ncbi:hypothetical protein NMY22_g17216 [Coprinellus aureogranulatus]|nr:hypothetical protein NMY22_g17216 [Coprinellus aureogranulatus]
MTCKRHHIARLIGSHYPTVALSSKLKRGRGRGFLAHYTPPPPHSLHRLEKFVILPIDTMHSSDHTNARASVAHNMPHNDMDSKDQRTIKNTLAAAEEHMKEARKHENDKTVTDPLAPARKQGHEPSRGAKVDAELQQDDEERLREKGIKH